MSASSESVEAVLDVELERSARDSRCCGVEGLGFKVRFGRIGVAVDGDDGVVDIFAVAGFAASDAASLAASRDSVMR